MMEFIKNNSNLPVYKLTTIGTPTWSVVTILVVVYTCSIILMSCLSLPIYHSLSHELGSISLCFYFIAAYTSLHLMKLIKIVDV